MKYFSTMGVVGIPQCALEVEEGPIEQLPIDFGYCTATVFSSPYGRK